MKYIPLSRDRQTIVDDKDYEELSKFKWHIANGYAVRHVSTNPDVREYMHRAINKTPKGLVTDHINGDKLDNRRKNLRVATVSQNGANYRIPADNTSGYKGVSIHKRTGLYRARIKKTTIGYYKTAEAAAKAYKEAAIELYGEFARTI